MKIIRLFIAFCFIVSQAEAQQFSILNEKSNQYETVIQTQNGEWRFSLFPGNIIKTVFIPVNSNKNENISDAVIANAKELKPIILKNKNNSIIKWNKNLNIYYSTNKITYQVFNTSITLKNTFITETERGFDFSLKDDEMIFGTGERSLPLNRRGYKIPLKNNPWYGYTLNADALNYSVPFILSNKNYAIFFDNPSKGFLDIGKTNPDEMRFSATSGQLSFYIIPGYNYQEIFNNYKLLVGTQPLPPRWAMGNFMSRFGYTSEAQTKTIFNNMKKDSIPFDALIFDLFWFGDSIQQTLGNLEWTNKKAWPNPKKMITDFKKEHVKTILITEPFVVNTSSRFEESKKYQAVDSNNNPFFMTDFYFGNGGLLDIFRNDTKKWFFDKYKAQMDIGVEGWWGDLGEPERHPSSMFHNLKDFGFDRKFGADEVHNIYGHYWSKMLYENYKKYYPHKRLFHLNRSGYVGSPRYSSFPWTGDVSRTWDGLKAQLPNIQGMSISGIPYVHSDAGGFSRSQPDSELYVRWLQFSVFTPIFRPHGTALGNLSNEENNIPSEPSEWPEPTKSLAKQAAIDRYKWLPYNYNLSYQQTVYGKPLITPIFFINENDSNLYNATQQYMWGENVMVVPITDKGATTSTYYIPSGNWTNIHDFKKVKGPQWIKDDQINISNIPVFVKEGSFIPFVAPMLNTDEYNNKELTIFYFPSSIKSSYTLYEDDGTNSDAIKDHLYELTSFKASSTNSKEINIQISSNGGHYSGQQLKREFKLSIPNIKAVKAVFINGKKLNQSFTNSSINGISIPVVFEHTKVEIRIIK